MRTTEPDLTTQPAIYFAHGGGPCFFMDPPPEEPKRWVGMEAYLRSVPKLLPKKPDALLVVSAHWEMPRPTVLSAALYERFRSREEHSFADRMLSAMRKGFGGHVEPKES